MADTDKLVKVGQLDTVVDAVIEEISDTNGRLVALEQGGGAGTPTEVRQAIFTLLSKAVYTDEGLTDEKAIIQSWATEVTDITLNQSAITISGATTSQLTAVTTPAGGMVTWSSSNPAVATVSSSGLVTGVSNGIVTITASSGGKRATCTATVTGFATLTGISAVYTQTRTIYDTDDLSDLVNDLVVTASYDNGTTATLTDSQYTLSGTLEEGNSTIVASYGGFTASFTVRVSHLDTTLIYSLPEPKTFNGTSDFVNTGASPFATDSDFTLVTTFKANVTQNKFCSVWASGAGDQMLMIRPTDATTGIWSTYAGGKNGAYIGANVQITSDDDVVRYIFRHKTGQKYEVFASVNGTVKQNGTQLGVENITTTSVEIRLGRSYSNGTYFTGTINEFMVYSRALTDQEIAAYLTP